MMAALLRFLSRRRFEEGGDMTWKKLGLLCGLLCVSSQSNAQEKSEFPDVDIEEETQKHLFESTYWMPERGVTLLKQKYAIKAWSRMRKKPCFVNVPKYPIIGLVAFKTEYFYIFAYHGQSFSDWIVCRKNGDLEFHAYGISGGYLDGNPKVTADICSSGGNTASARFRNYTKEGPLLLEVHVGGCRGGESHHEFLFHLDESELEEVKGSRIVMHDYFNYSEAKRGWLWWPYKKYERFSSLSWTDNDELKWTKLLYKIPLSMFEYRMDPSDYDYDMSLHELSCQYNEKSRDVSCESEILKKVNIDIKGALKRSDGSEDYYQNLYKHIKEVKPMGYKVEDSDFKKLKKKALEEKERQQERVKTTTR